MTVTYSDDFSTLNTDKWDIGHNDYYKDTGYPDGVRVDDANHPLRFAHPTLEREFSFTPKLYLWSGASNPRIHFLFDLDENWDYGLDSGYYVELDPPNDEIKVANASTGTTLTTAPSSYNFETGTNFDVEVAYTSSSNELTVSIDGTQQLSLTEDLDGSYGGFGLSMVTEYEAFHLVGAEVEWTEPPSIDPPLDPAAEYDSAADEVQISWTDNNDNNTGHRVYDDGTQIADLGESSDSYTVTNPEYLSLSTYAIEAYGPIDGSTETTSVTAAESVGPWGVDSASYSTYSPDPVDPGVEDGSGSGIQLAVSGVFVGGSAEYSETEADVEVNDEQYVGIPTSADTGFSLDSSHTYTRDTDANWPVKVVAQILVDGVNAENLSDWSAYAEVDGECEVDATVLSTTSSDGQQVVDVEFQYDCPSAEKEDMEVETSLYARGDDVEVTQTGIGGPSGFDSPDNPTIGTLGFTPEPPDAKYIGIPSRCTPQGSRIMVPVRTNVQGFDEYDFRIAFDSDVVEYVDARGTEGGERKGFSAPETVVYDNDTGYVQLNSTDSYHNPDSIEHKSSIVNLVFDVVGPHQSSTDLTFVSQSSDLLLNGSSATRNEYYSDGSVMAESGINVASVSASHSEVKRMPVTISSGESIESGVVKLNFTTQTIESWSLTEAPGFEIMDSLRENGVLTVTVREDGYNPDVHGDVFYIDAKMYSPETHGRVSTRRDRRTNPFKIMDGTEFRNADGDLVPIVCRHDGGITLSYYELESNLSGGGGEEEETASGSIPEFGVAYWPIVFSRWMTFSGIKANDVSSAEPIISSETNPDIDAKEIASNVVDESTYESLISVVIPKADPQNYPVKYELGFWLNFQSASGLLVGGSGIATGTDLQNQKVSFSMGRQGSGGGFSL